MDDRNRSGGKSAAQIGGKIVVQFDGHHACGACGEGASDGSRAGADFDDGAAGEIAQRGSDALDGLLIGEKVLAELGFRGHWFL